MKVIKTNQAPAAIGPYEQAILSDNFVFCSGQIGLNPETGELAEGLENQIKQIMKNIEGVLQEAGTDLTHIVKTTLFIANINDYPTVNELYGQSFFEHKPARSTVGVAALPKNALIEIEVIAELPIDSI